MTSRRPTVRASHHRDYAYEELRAYQPGRTPEVVQTVTAPGVDLTVKFDLHDHEAALAALDRAVADVRSQIEETR